MSARLIRSQLGRLKTVSKAVIAAVLILNGIVLAARLTQIPTATAFILTAIVLLLRGDGRWKTAVRRTLSALTLVIVAAAYACGRGWLVGCPITMSLLAAVSFCLLHAATVFLKGRRVFSWSQFLIGTVAFIAFMSILGHVYQIRYLYSIPSSIGMSVQSALYFLALSAALILAKPSAFFLKVLAGRDPGGILLRHILPAVFLVPITIGCLRLFAEYRGWIDDQAGAALATILYFILFLGLLMWSARTLNHLYGQTKAAEAKLVKNQRELLFRERERSALLSQVIVGIATKDMNGRFLYANDRYCKIVGRPLKELLRMRWQDITHPDDFSRHATLLTEAVSNDKDITQEKRYIRPDGSVVWVQNSFSLVRNAAGEPQYVATVCLDVSDRKSADESRRQTDHLVETVNRLGQQLLTELRLERIVRSVITAATNLCRAEFGVFCYSTVNEKGEYVTEYAASGSPEKFNFHPQFGQSDLFGRTLDRVERVRIDDVKKIPNGQGHAPGNGRWSMASYLAVPVKTPAGDVLGGIFLGHSAVARFTETHERIVSGLAAQVSIAIENARLFEAQKRVEQQLRLTQAGLEEKVRERTRELADANDTLRKEMLHKTRTGRDGEPAPPGAKRIRVFVVDDHPVVRKGIIQLLLDDPYFEICGEAEEAEGAIRGILETRSDIALVDISLKGSNGLDLVRRLSQIAPDLPSLIVSMHDEFVYAEKAFAAGASGYVLKQDASESLVKAVRTVLSGKQYVSDRLVSSSDGAIRLSRNTN